MRFLYIAIFLIAVTSCNKTTCKEGDEHPSPPVNATVKWSGPPEADGLGWVLLIENGKMEKPSNLADQFKTDGLKVAVIYEPSNEKFPCFCAGGFINMIRIVSITKR